MKVKFALDRETKGALVYKELDAKGKVVASVSDGKIGQLYIRKSAYPDGKYPPGITVMVEPFIEPWKE